MENKPKFANRFLLLITHLVTGTVLAEIATIGMIASPSQAATLASSQATLEFNNFSSTPLDTQTLSDTNTLAIAEPGSSATAVAEAEATFIVDPAFAFDLSLSTAAGEGSNYLGLAESQAQVIGNFFVEAGQSFSFDFTADLNLNTSIDDPSFENASASGDLGFFLVDSNEQTNIYDFFVVSGSLTTPGNDFLDAENSDNVILNRTSYTTNFGEPEESVVVSVDGSLERSFDQPTAITLIEAKANQASVPVPETESTVALLFFLGFMGIRYTAKKKHLEGV